MVICKDTVQGSEERWPTQQHGTPTWPPGPTIQQRGTPNQPPGPIAQQCGTPAQASGPTRVLSQDSAHTLLNVVSNVPVPILPLFVILHVGGRRTACGEVVQSSHSVEWRYPGVFPHVEFTHQGQGFLCRILHHVGL